MREAQPGCLLHLSCAAAAGSRGPWLCCPGRNACAAPPFAGELRLVFTQIDAADPERQFWAALLAKEDSSLSGESASAHLVLRSPRAHRAWLPALPPAFTGARSSSPPAAASTSACAYEGLACRPPAAAVTQCEPPLAAFPQLPFEFGQQELPHVVKLIRREFQALASGV